VKTITSPIDIAASLTELWSPRVIDELDDTYVKVAKIQGVFGWHQHAEEDELFYLLRGQLRLEMHAGDVELSAGQMFVVPKGVEHNPVAAEECLIMLIEKKATLHTGNIVNDKTRSLAEQLRPT
jgi:mannose-6-phosphate isomerase-like protein (cupin superfamily)